MQIYKCIASASPILLHRQHRVAAGGRAGALLLLGIDNATLGVPLKRRH
jgi:hypothetical protein